MKTEANKVKAKLLEKKPAEKIDWKAGLSTGSTLLNLSITGRTNVGLLAGHYFLLVGDTNSGKTFFSRVLLAEAANNPKFDGYHLIYDDVEDGALMDTAKFFGKKLEERMDRFPSSRTVEEFYFNVSDQLDSGQPFIYILDSMDGLSSTPELEKFQERKAAARKDKEITGSYGDGKAKRNSQDLRQVRNRLKETGSILVIINQTRDNLGFGAMFQPKSRSGGHALEFYAAAQLWTSVKEKIKRQVKGKKRQIGIISKVQVKRSRFTGREGSVEIPIFWSTGIDDVGSMILWLINEGYWKGTKEKVEAPEFDWNGPIEELVEKIEVEGKERQLRMLIAAHWRAVEEACAVKRKKRYE
jgi:RecA/RadA recombinase